MTGPDTEVPVLPEGALLLHIGPPKTGSTAIQMALHNTRPELRGHGVLYPGTRMRARSAAAAVLGIGSPVGRDQPKIERWHAIVDEIAGTDLPRVCMSHESFSRADDAAVSRILDDLGAERTHVVYVARRLDKVLPSHWQERVKAWSDVPFEEFLHLMLDDPDAPQAQRIWQPHDLGAVVGRWAAAVGREKVTVLVADEHDRDLIPRTFETMLGLPEGMLVPPADRSNTSLSFTEAEAIRRLNQMAREDDWSSREYWKVMQRGVVQALARRDRSGDARIQGLPAWALERVAERADRQVSQVEQAGVRVIGDPGRLRVRDGVESAEVPEAVQGVSLDLLADLVSGAVAGSRGMHRDDLKAAAKADRKAAPGRRREELPTRELVRLLARRAVRRSR
jgi:hypothetical protein